MTIEADYDPDFETMFGESPSTGPEMGAEDKYGAASDAIRFLKAFHEGGRHNIVAIHPNGGGSVGRTFGPNSWDGMAGYINRLHANGYNIYFTVNEPKAGAPDSKLDKTEIGSIRAVYADPDIRDGRDRGAERQRILEAIEGLGCTTTCIIGSGNGFHPQWWLEVPMVADDATKELAEGIGRTIAIRLGADHVQNIDRIMRLPGLTNSPDADKRKRGRTAQPTRLHSEGGPRYTLEELAKIFPPTAAAADHINDEEVTAWAEQIDMEAVGAATSWDALPEDLRTRWDAALGDDANLRSVWERGKKPRGPQGGGDGDVTGSGHLWWLGRQLVMLGVFTITEFGMLAQVWGFTSDGNDLSKNPTRALARVWGKLMKEKATGATFGAVGTGGNRVRIKIRGGEISRMADEAHDVLIATGVPIFSHGGVLSKVVSFKGPSAIKDVETTFLGIAPVNAAYLRDKLNQVAVFGRFDIRTRKWRDTNPPREVVETIMARDDSWEFRRLDGVASTQTLRADGSVVDTDGYDAATHTVFMGLPSMTALPAKLSRRDAEEALLLLEDLLAEFPFVDETGRSVALAALVTAVTRPMFAAVPMFAVLANLAGSGKSFLCDLVSAIATGHRCPVLAIGADDKETDARLNGALLQGRQIISFDNVNGELGTDLLCQATERQMLDLRPLGTSRNQVVNNRALVLANGNNIAIKGDMTRRTLMASLDAGVERPETREFRGDPLAEVMKDRGKYVRACLVIVREYIDAGSPGLLRRLASYEEWSDRVRSALVWLGREDPVKTQDALRAGDPEAERFRILMTAWYGAFRDRPMTVRDVLQVIAFDEVLKDAALAITGTRAKEVDQTRLSNWLRQNRDTRRSGFHLTGHKPNTKRLGIAWSVEWIGTAGDAPTCTAGGKMRAALHALDSGEDPKVAGDYAEEDDPF